MKQKILFIITSLGGGGGEKVLVTTLKNFDYTRFEVHLCVITKWGVYLDDIPEQVKVFYLYENPASLFAKVSFNLYSRFRVSLLERWKIRSVVEDQYDTIISFMEGRSLKFHGYVMDRAGKSVTWVHTDMINNHYTIGDVLSAADEERIYRSMDSIVFVSNEAKSQFQKLYKIENEQVVVLNPIDRELIRELAQTKVVEKSRFVIGSIGGLREPKAYDRLVRVAAMAKRDGYDVEFWIVGDGELRGELERQIEELDVADSVKLLGFQNPPYPYLAQFDLFLSTSLVEGYPLVVGEALCLGIPIVATRCTGPVEMLDGGEYGVITEQDDESIYRGVKSLLDDTNLMKCYVAKSQARSAIFDIAFTMNEIYNIIS